MEVRGPFEGPAKATEAMRELVGFTGEGAGENGFGDFCRSCSSLNPRHLCILHIGHNKSTACAGHRQGGREVEQCREQLPSRRPVSILSPKATR